MAYKQKRDKGFYYYLDLIERTARKYEVDLVATGRYDYIKTDGNHRLYREKATGNIVRVLIPYIPSQESNVSTDATDSKI